MRKQTLLALTTAFLLAFMVGCRKEEAPAPAERAVAPAPPVDPATAATLVGKVNYQDGRPRRVPLRMDADAACKAMHKEPVYSEEVVVNDNGTLRWTTVYIKEGLGDRSFAVPAQPVELDQEGCVYTPRVVALMANQEIHIVNSDQTTHNIHPVPRVNREWNESQPPGAAKLVKTFPREEVGIPVKCNIHPWMRSYVHVFRHPFFAVTKQDGSFEIKGLPPGDYTLAAWHEKFGEQEMKVTVAAQETKTVEFTFSPAGGG